MRRQVILDFGLGCIFSLAIIGLVKCGSDRVYTEDNESIYDVQYPKYGPEAQAECDQFGGEIVIHNDGSATCQNTDL
jgi:hypothetical protein